MTRSRSRSEPAAARAVRDVGEPFADAGTGYLCQDGAGVRFEWGPSGAKTLVGGTGAAVVVDVLSFTSAVSVATGRGIAVAPHPLDDAGAVELAARLRAAVAVSRRRRSDEHPWTLSPAALLAAPYTARLVLPSPNGSAIAAGLHRAERSGGARAHRGGVAIVAGCLRNVTATARWLLAHGYGADSCPVWLVGAGERWPDGSLRPALEDLLGAGALAGALADAGCTLSAEARAAAHAFAATSDLGGVVADCVSGRELAAHGFPDEAAVAAALDADDHASVMDGDLFVQVDR